MGTTGAGKSTLAAVLFLFVDLSSGTVRLNDRDLAGNDPDDVRAVIAGSWSWHAGRAAGQIIEQVAPLASGTGCEAGRELGFRV